jgi:hypothetical protein
LSGVSAYGIAPGFPPSWGEGVNIFGGSKDLLKENMIISVVSVVKSFETALRAV